MEFLVFERLRIPILLLLGGETSLVYKAAIEALHSALPTSRLVVLPWQGHDAVVTAPELFLREVRRLLLE